MRVVVAGGAGFIGSHVCRELLRRGHSVLCIDSLLTGSYANIADLAGERKFDFEEADVVEIGHYRADRILHLASPASPVDYDRLPLQTMMANSEGTWRLLEVALETNAVMTFVSTSEVYGDPQVHPQDETYWGNVDPIGPRSCYDESKRFGEALVFVMRRTSGVRANVVRVFNTYGPNMRANDGRVMPEMIGAALDGRPVPVYGDGKQTRSFCYVDDLVDGLLHVGLDPKLDGAVMNLGNPDEISMLRLAQRIVRLTNSTSVIEHLPARPGDPAMRKPDIGRMHGRYGWHPKIGLDEGLRRTIDWYAASR